MAKEEQAAPEADEGGSKKKLILIIGIGVVVALLLGGVAFMMLGGKKDGEAKKEGAAAEAKAGGGHGAAAPAGGGHGGDGKGGPAGPANMYNLDAFIVNIYDGQELRYLKLKIELEMAGDFKAEVDSRLPPIRDAILVLLSTKTLQDIHEVQGKNQLREEILAAINKVLPPGKVSKVYFTDFVVQ